MANLDFYRRAIGVNTVDELSDAICASLLKTNRTYDFWVDWDKANRNSNEYKYQLGLLATLKGSDTPRKDLERLLRRYPEVAEAFPRLLAEHENQLTVLSRQSHPFKYIDLDFSTRDRSSADIRQLATFAEKTGLLEMLSNVAQPQDYLFGVEVGLDSNARKNRSGVVLESLVSDAVDALARVNKGVVCLKQPILNQAAKTFDVECPSSMSARRLDFALLRRGVPTNIEVNFYGGTGSKPSEIVGAYCDRARILKEHGRRFVWVTDGPGWLKMRNPLRVGVEGIDYVLNYQMLHDGLLARILLQG